MKTTNNQIKKTRKLITKGGITIDYLFKNVIYKRCVNIYTLQHYILQPMHLSKYLALNSKAFSILGCVNFVCWHLIGVFRRAFELTDAQENKKQTSTARAEFNIKIPMFDLRKENARDGHCDGGIATISGYKIIVTTDSYFRRTPCIFLWFDSPSEPRPPHYWGLAITLRHTTLGRTPLEE